MNKERSMAWLASNMDVLLSWANGESKVPQSIRHCILESWQMTDSLSKGLAPSTVIRHVNCRKCGALVWELDVSALTFGKHANESDKVAQADCSTPHASPASPSSLKKEGEV